MSRGLGWFVAVSGLAVVHCGGRAELDFEPEASPSGGAAATADDCNDEVPDAGCMAGDAGGDAGSSPLEPYARLRTACAKNITINRRGPAVPLCHHIK